MKCQWQMFYYCIIQFTTTSQLPCQQAFFSLLFPNCPRVQKSLYLDQFYARVAIKIVSGFFFSTFCPVEGPTVQKMRKWQRERSVFRRQGGSFSKDYILGVFPIISTVSCVGPVFYPGKLTTFGKVKNHNNIFLGLNECRTEQQSSCLRKEWSSEVLNQILGRQNCTGKMHQ